MGEPEEPMTYGKCRIEREIAHGAASTVYLAWHEALQISVALKVIRKQEGLQDSSLSRRVMREAHIAAQLTHPNIMRIYDCGETEDAYYLVLEYIEGKNCHEKLDEDGAFEWREAASIIRQAAEGLRHAHQRGVIHRDLKPQNIMIDGEGNARIADLGLAKVAAPGKPSETLGGDVLGTAYYMSPEQVRQPGEVDFRSDIYSLGATLYHMVTGLPPFDAPTPFEVMAKHLDVPITSPREKKPDLPEGLCALIMRTMAKDPHERHQSYEELIGELDALLGGEPVAEAPAPPIEIGLEEQPQEQPEEQPAALELDAEPPVRALPIEPGRLRVTVENVQTKMMGLLSLLASTFFVVWLYHVLTDPLGPAAGIAVAAGIVVVSGAWSSLVFRRGSRDAGADDSGELEEKLRPTLERLCERLGLPVPRLRISRRLDDACYAYGLSPRKASVDIPGGWLRQADLSQKETEAFLAQSLSSIYNGDASIRTLLAFPMEVLKARRSLLVRAMGRIPALRPAAGVWLFRGLTVAGIVGVCALIALLFWVSSWAGALGVLFIGLLLLLAGFERSCRYAGDAFAAEVVESKEIVEALVAVSGLAGVEGCLLRRGLARASGAGNVSAGAAQTDARRLAGSVVARYRKAKYSAGILERIRLLFSPVPSAGERLNQLAGVAGGRLSVAEGVLSARRMFTVLAGSQDEEPMHLRELSGMGFHGAVGIIEGVVAVAILALPLRWGAAAHYAGFLGLLAVLGSASGILLAALLLPGRLSGGRFGWAVIVTSVFFTCMSMLGLCLAGGRTLPPFAFPVFSVLAGFFAFLIGAMVARLWRMVAARTGRAGDEATVQEAEAVKGSADEKGAAEATQAPGEPSDSASSHTVEDAGEGE